MIYSSPLDKTYLNKLCNIVIWLMISGLSLLTFSCGNQHYARELESIDSLLHSDPDSAYMMLCKYDTTQLQNSGDKHYYSLLKAEASDKTFRDNPPQGKDDISEAANYFIRSNDRKNGMRSLYYEGRMFQNNGKCAQALISFLKSLELGDTTEHLYRGKINSSISEIYQDIGDAPHELEYARRALEEYNKLDSLVFIEDMQLAYGYALSRNNRGGEGIKLMQGVYAKAKKRNDSITAINALKYIALGYLFNYDNVNAKRCLSLCYSALEDKCSFGDYLCLYLNCMINTDAPADSIESLAHTLLECDNANDLPYYYYEYKKDYTRAYSSAKHTISQNDSLIINILRNNVGYEVSSYLKGRQHLAEMRVSQLNGLIIWISISAILIICLILTFLRLLVVNKRKKEKDLLYSIEIIIKEKSDIVKSMVKLSEDNKCLSEENTSLKNEKSLSQQNKNGNANYESNLIADLFHELDALHSDYYKNGINENGQKAILNHLAHQLSLLREDKGMLRNMEGHINNVFDGLLDDVYSFVRLNDDQRRIVSFLYLGFSKESVSQIMNISLQNYYTRMYRLVKRIEGCDAPRKEELLSKIQRKED